MQSNRIEKIPEGITKLCELLTLNVDYTLLKGNILITIDKTEKIDNTITGLPGYITKLQKLEVENLYQKIAYKKNKLIVLQCS